MVGVIAVAPLGTAAVWLGLAAYQVSRGRYRTWTEVFFLAACVSVAAYAVFDVLFFIAPDEAWAVRAAVASLFSMTFISLFFMLYGVVLHTRFHRNLFLSFIPLAFLLYLIPTSVLIHVTPRADIGVNYLPEYDPTWFGVWALALLVLILTALGAIFRTYIEVRRQSRPLARRLLNVIAGFVLAILLSLFTNTAGSLLNWDIPPLLSTALVVPGLFMFVAVSPLSERSLTEVLRRWKARDYEVQGAFILYQDGTLVGSELAPGQDMVDRDLFSTTLDVIQNFMRTSFPALRGKWLQSIRHGDYTLVVERGDRVSVVLVLKGRENDQLRRHIRELAARFEERNHAVLEEWKGVAANVEGLEDALHDLLS